MPNEYKASVSLEFSTVGAVRRRPGMYVGSTGEYGVDHLVSEVVSNAIDQFLVGVGTRVQVDQVGDVVTVADDGPGLPFDKPGPNGQTLAEYYLTTLHFGKTADEHVPHAHLERRGVGLCVVNALSESLEVRTLRNGTCWTQRYLAGVPQSPPQVADASATDVGTIIRFQPDRTIFTVQASIARLRPVLFEAAHLFPGLTVEVGAERFQTSGLSGLALLLDPNKAYERRVVTARGTSGAVQFDVAVVVPDPTCRHLASAGVWRSWANGVVTAAGGTHLLVLRNALAALSVEPTTALVHVILLDPRYAGPTKDKLEMPDFAESLTAMIRNGLQNAQ